MDEISVLGVKVDDADSFAKDSKSISKSPPSFDVNGLSDAKVLTALSVDGVSDMCSFDEVRLDDRPKLHLCDGSTDENACTDANDNTTAAIVDFMILNWFKIMRMVPNNSKQ